MTSNGRATKGLESGSASRSESHSICDKGGRVDMLVFGCSRSFEILRIAYYCNLFIFFFS
jgi:hypothetical protein